MCGAAIGLLFGSAVSGDAKTWTVSTKIDAAGMPGSLRYIVAKAGNGDTINFSSGGSDLASAIALTKNVTIEGTATIRQNGTGRVFSIPAGVTVTLRKLTISGGKGERSGGGIYSEGELTMTDCTVSGNSAAEGAGIFSGSWSSATRTRTGTLTMTGCTIDNNAASQSGGGIHSLATLNLSGCALRGNSAAYWGGALFLGEHSQSAMTNCTISGNGSRDGAGIHSQGYVSNIQGCVFSGNVASRNGGGFYNSNGIVRLTGSSVTGNSAATSGGGLYNNYIPGGRDIELRGGTSVAGNTPDQVSGYYTTDGSCTIGTEPNRSATAFAGYAGDTAPEPRSIIGDADVAEVKGSLADSGSDLFAAVADALSKDLGGGSGDMAASLAGITASLNYANTFENVALTSADLAVEYTASWPENVRYYALFARADGSGYELLDRGVQFEIRAGQNLPDGVTPPDFYVPGEGLMTWKNIVTDNGSYDLNPGVGAVTFRVCSVRAAYAAETTGDKGSGGGCNASAGADAPLALLLVAPMFIAARARKRRT
jgi:Synergist-CTERM protein sorting domain-containing protein